MQVEVNYYSSVGDRKWHTRWVDTIDEAWNIVDSYRSDGSEAYISPSSLVRFSSLRYPLK